LQNGNFALQTIAVVLVCSIQPIVELTATARR
jgi:hypothetical protein